MVLENTKVIVQLICGATEEQTKATLTFFKRLNTPLFGTSRLALYNSKVPYRQCFSLSVGGNFNKGFVGPTAVLKGDFGDLVIFHVETLELTEQ